MKNKYVHVFISSFAYFIVHPHKRLATSKIIIDGAVSNLLKRSGIAFMSLVRPGNARRKLLKSLL